MTKPAKNKITWFYDFQQISVHIFPFPAITCACYSIFVKWLQAQVWSVDFTNFWRVFTIWNYCAPSIQPAHDLAVLQPGCLKVGTWYALHLVNHAVDRWTLCEDAMMVRLQPEPWRGCVQKQIPSNCGIELPRESCITGHPTEHA